MRKPTNWCPKFLLLGLVLSPIFSAQAAPSAPPLLLKDNFSNYALGSAGQPCWRALDVGFAVRAGARANGGAAMVAENPGPRGFLEWRAAPPLRRGVMEATVTPRQATGVDRKGAGIGLYLDGDNFWELALVESAQGEGNRHTVEMSEMRSGRWKDDASGASRLTTIEDSGAFAWSLNKPYRLRLTLGRDRIAGEVFEGTTRRYRCVRLLNKPAITIGVFMLSASRCTSAFSDARAAITQKADATTFARLTTPTAPPPFHWGAPRNGRATLHDGYFHTAREGNTWWLRDPHNQRTLAVGTDWVNYNTHWCQKLGYAPYHRNVQALYGSEAAWSKVATHRLRAWHFNTLGAGNGDSTHYQGLSHTAFLSFGADFSATASIVPKINWTGWPDVFDPRWPQFCELRAAQVCDRGRHDPWLLGYFLDNELQWWGEKFAPWGLAQDAWKLPQNQPARLALVAALQNFYKGDVGLLNADFGTHFSSFNALSASAVPPERASERGKQALMSFVEVAARRYFTTTTAAVRRHDPNHLILGCRFSTDAPQPVWRAAGATCDIVSENMYPRIDFEQQVVQGLDAKLRRDYALCGKPIMLTEWGFPGLDAHDSRGLPLPSQHGVGMRVDTQEQRARCFQIMQSSLFALPFVVGSDFFMWDDEPALGILSTFPEDGNYGLVSDGDVPYARLTTAVARTNLQVFDLHSGRGKRERLPLLSLSPKWLLKPAATTPAESTPTVLREHRGGYSIDNGLLRLEKHLPNGDIFNHVSLRSSKPQSWVELGSYGLLIKQEVHGQNLWVRPDRVVDEAVRTEGSRLVIDVTLEKVAGAGTPITAVGTAAPAAGSISPAQPFRCAFRIVVDANRPCFVAKCLWVENTGAEPLHWLGYYHYATANFGGDAGDASVLDPGVPEYWLPLGAWRSSRLHLDYGVLPVVGSALLSTTFWKDDNGTQHPDCYRGLDLRLKPGHRWTAAAGEPVVAVFGFNAPRASARPWVALMHPNATN